MVGTFTRPAAPTFSEIPEGSNIRNSNHVISKLINGNPLGAVNCRRLYNKVKLLMHNSYEPLHILRLNNSATDIMANLGASLPQGHYRKNGNPPILKFVP